MELTPTQLIKISILKTAEINCGKLNNLQLIYEDGEDLLLTSETIDEDYDGMKNEYDEIREEEEEFREGGLSTNLSSDSYSRHYDCQEVAACLSGIWVGWTYWSGGGKFGEPASIDWMEDAYFLDVVEEEKVVTVRTFNKKEV